MPGIVPIWYDQEGKAQRIPSDWYDQTISLPGGRTVTGRDLSAEAGGLSKTNYLQQLGYAGPSALTDYYRSWRSTQGGGTVPAPTAPTGAGAGVETSPAGTVTPTQGTDWNARLGQQGYQSPTNPWWTQYDWSKDRSGMYSQLAFMADKLRNYYGGTLESFDPRWQEVNDLGQRYLQLQQHLYNTQPFEGEWGQYGANLGYYDPTKSVQEAWNGPTGTTANPNATPTNPQAGAASNAPTFSSIMNSLMTGAPAGIDIQSEEGARALEVMYPFAKDAYNAAMQKAGLDVGYQNLEQLKQDPILKATADSVLAQVENPYTFDQETMNLMRSRAADTIANQEASLGERLRALGARQGISPDSPLYASLASQAAMARDINMANMERDLLIQKAQQDQADKQRSAALGAQFGGAYQSLMGQGYGNLMNMYGGAQLTNVANPFAGLWQGMLMEDAINSGGDTDWLSLLAQGAGAVAPWAGLAFGPAGAAAGAAGGGALGRIGGVQVP